MNRRPKNGGRGLGLRTRVFLLVGVGVLGPGAVLAAALHSRLGQLDERLVAGRQNAVSAVAGQLDAELLEDLETLQRAASAPHVNLEDADDAAERAALRDLYLHARFPGGVFFLDASGRVVAEEPARARVASLTPDARDVREVLAGRPGVSRLIRDGAAWRAYAMVPVRNWEGRVVGLAGGAIDATQERYVRMLRYLRRGRESFADVVDGDGNVLASTDPGHLHRPAECGGVRAAIVARRPAAGRCDDCHFGRPADERGRGVLAIAPLSVAPWAVAVRLPESEVLASVGAFPWSFVALAMLLLSLGALLAWGAARSVTRPVAVMTTAAERIAAGGLEEPIPDLGVDEVGRLGRSLERMRSSLRESIGLVARANEELEGRVRDRTAELERVNSRLRDREQALAQLYRKVVGAQEEERRRIARELHDETSQSLAVLVMGIDSASAAAKAGLTPRLEEVKALAVRLIEEVHRLILDLRPSVLDDLGLLSAIQWYADRYLKSRGIAVRCEFGPMEEHLPPELETALFRMCQEAMSNIAKHAGAETVLVQVSRDGDVLHIEIEDDGRGFDPQKVGGSERRPFGLLGIRERAELLGGTAEIDSAPGKGTRVHVRVPLLRQVA